ncbi:MAG: chemotaxis protein CheC [Candidatus Kariarchaeaceae archaeon]|jgi:chemotaxis protein CheC
MGYDYDEFLNAGYEDFEIEALQELSNIGVGHAATALSQLLHRRVDMSIPLVELIHMNNLGERIAGSLETVVAGILVDTIDEKDRMLNFLMIFDKISTHNILKILKSGETPKNLKSLDEISKSIIKETGNILLLHTISAINSFTESKWFPKAPQLSIDMVGAMIEEIIGRDYNIRNKFLLIECDVYTAEESLKGIIILLPSDSTRKTIMSRLYGDDIYNQS